MDSVRNLLFVVGVMGVVYAHLIPIWALVMYRRTAHRMRDAKRFWRKLAVAYEFLALTLIAIGARAFHLPELVGLLVGCAGVLCVVMWSVLSALTFSSGLNLPPDYNHAPEQEA